MPGTLEAPTERSLIAAMLETERRTSRRENIPRQLLACPFGPEYREEVQTTSNSSRDGLYFTTRSSHYRVGMPVSVIVGYAPAARCDAPSFGKVIRIDRLKDGLGIAVRILMR
jgi:hypothetical protein